ncbi:MAG: hypothetical protein HUN04_25815 [Desulfobacter sp.]|nr:MAG: hypothetical protein HUN04_25815 [Desulfobacter sp.]
MMNLTFFFIAALTLILCQTIVLPGTVLFSHGFDILLIVVLHMSLAFSHYGVVVAIIVLGTVMDSISGGPFFIHIFSYLWVYLIVKLFRQFVFHRSALFIMAVSFAAVGIQQGLVLFSVFVSHGQAGWLGVDYSLVLEQMVLGSLCIPAGVWLMNVMRQNWIVLLRQLRRSLARRYRE